LEIPLVRVIANKLQTSLNYSIIIADSITARSQRRNAALIGIDLGGNIRSELRSLAHRSLTAARFGLHRRHRGFVPKSPIKGTELYADTLIDRDECEGGAVFQQSGKRCRETLAAENVALQFPVPVSRFHSIERAAGESNRLI